MQALLARFQAADKDRCAALWGEGGLLCGGVPLQQVLFTVAPHCITRLCDPATACLRCCYQTALPPLLTPPCLCSNGVIDREELRALLERVGDGEDEVPMVGGGSGRGRGGSGRGSEAEGRHGAGRERGRQQGRRQGRGELVGWGQVVLEGLLVTLEGLLQQTRRCLLSTCCAFGSPPCSRCLAVPPSESCPLPRSLAIHPSPRFPPRVCSTG